MQKQNDGKLSKDISTLTAKFEGDFSIDGSIIVVFDGHKVKGCPLENYNAVKPFDS